MIFEAKTYHKVKMHNFLKYKVKITVMKFDEIESWKF